MINLTYFFPWNDMSKKNMHEHNFFRQSNNLFRSPRKLCRWPSPPAHRPTMLCHGLGRTRSATSGLCRQEHRPEQSWPEPLWPTKQVQGLRRLQPELSGFKAKNLACGSLLTYSSYIIYLNRQCIVRVFFYTNHEQLSCLNVILMNVLLHWKLCF